MAGSSERHAMPGSLALGGDHIHVPGQNDRNGATSPRLIGAIGGHRSASASTPKIGNGTASGHTSASSNSISTLLGDGGSSSSNSDTSTSSPTKPMMSSPISVHAQVVPPSSSSDTSSSHTAPSGGNVWSLPGGASRFLQSGSGSAKLDSSSSDALSFFITHNQQMSSSSNDADNSFNNTHGDFYPGGSEAEDGDTHAQADRSSHPYQSGGQGSQERQGATGAGAGTADTSGTMLSTSGGTLHARGAERDTGATVSPALNGSSGGSGTPHLSEYGTPRLYLDATGDSNSPGTSGHASQQQGSAGGNSDALRGSGNASAEDANVTPLARPHALNGTAGSSHGAGQQQPGHVDRLAIIREKNASRAAAAAANNPQQHAADADGNTPIREVANLPAVSKSPQRVDSAGGTSSDGEHAQHHAHANSYQQQSNLSTITSPLVLTGINGWGIGGSSERGGAASAQGYGRSGTPLLSLPGPVFDTSNAGIGGAAGAVAAGASRFGSLAGGLLSPSTATVGFGAGPGGQPSAAFSPIASPTAMQQAGGSFSQAFGGPPGHGQQQHSHSHPHALAHPHSYPHSHAHPIAGTATGPHSSLYTPQPQPHAGGALLVPSEYDSPLDLRLKQSPLIIELVDRLVRLEIGLKDLQRQVGGISRSVNYLQDRARASGGVAGAAAVGASGAGGIGGPGGVYTRAQSPQIGGYAARTLDGLPAASTDEIRNLSAQLSSLSTSVAQLFQSQQQLQGGLPLPQHATSPLIPSGASAFGGSQQQRLAASIDPSSRLSPRPFQGPAPGNRLSWGASAEIGSGGSSGPGGVSSGGVGGRKAGGSSRRDSSSIGAGGSGYGDDARSASFSQSAAGINGAAGSEANFVITKWDHLNLHPDLLRSVLKYGLGPPNKIQQRALPFLLRGNDIIAQAPPTQERIASYVIPALQHVLSALREPGIPSNARGPIVLMISTTVDQATQAQRMALGLGSPIGLRVHIAAAAGIDIASELQTMAQINPHIVIGTPQKMSELFTQLVARNALPANDVRLVVLDEVDQLIARNLSDHVSSLLRVLPMPRATPGAKGSLISPAASSSAKNGWDSISVSSPGGASAAAGGTATMDRQTAIFSNTVPQDVLNFAQSIHLRESVRVLVRRENSNMIGGGGGGGGGLGGGSGMGGGGSGAGGGSGLGGGPASSIGNGTFGAGSTAGPYGSQSMGGFGGSRVQAAPSGAMPPSNALGSTPMVNISANPLADPMLSALRGLRQYYLYVAVSGNNNATAMGGTSSALEMKLDVITDLLEDMDFGQAVIYTAAPGTTEAVTYKLSSKGIESLAVHKDMASATRARILQKFRAPGSAFVSHGNPLTPARKALVINDTALSPKEVHQVPLVVFYDLPRSVEEYKEK
ncbi:hypothetical protein K437DRAFT_188797 [Tilletiaria anomala UBC 951]|uniref:Helicase ATP-binding domain-containing protein n=1 Tax=Tilletiaria anomala (strain ATCC 24038 / CBS 436.72 / UBC 951) TaxID=1037660 RepID=A0A066VJP9_TILAU|nr:uncharacterized protein K437DRAFT_188797 [Tilletiaria anomala UBC 951]KDN40538.1 hypothetical protein K437DRAFT_188797 [Tilletiaria anomala UBC 951]